MDADCVVGSWMGCGRVKSFWLKGGLSVLTIGVDGRSEEHTSELSHQHRSRMPSSA